jgi:hypothetical protein
LKKIIEEQGGIDHHISEGEDQLTNEGEDQLTNEGEDLSVVDIDEEEEDDKILETAQVLKLILSSIMTYSSCEIVALWKNIVDRPESYDLFSAKSCIFLAHEKTRMVWGTSLCFHTQTAPKQGIKYS